MSVFTKKAVDIFAPVRADGTPRPVSNVDAQVWGTELERLIDSVLTVGGKIYPSKSAMDADLSPAANTSAIVIGDPVAANNGLYMKTGGAGTGAWQRVGDVPGYQIIPLTNAGAGTENALAATSALPVPQADRTAIMLLNVTAANTGAVTVAVNAEGPRPLQTNSGEDIEPGYIRAGMVLAFVREGAAFRLLSDVASAAIQSAAEAAKDAAEAAQQAAEDARDIAVNAASDIISQGNVPIYSTRNAVEGLEIPAGMTAIRTNGYAIPGDVGAALYKRVAVEPSHAGKVQSADGAWWELAEDQPNVKMFGAVGNGGTSDQAAIVAAVGYAYDNGVELYWPEGSYVSNTNIPNLHKVCHHGTGKVLRGSAIFYLSPSPIQSNVIYYDETGSPDNDGLHPTQKINSLSVAYDSVFSQRSSMKGSWKFYRSSTRSVDLDNGEFIQPTVVQIPADFPHLDDAFSFLRRHKVAHNNLISVRMQAGYRISRGVAFRYDDFSRVEITSDDATVPVDATFVGVNVTADPFEANSLIVAWNSKAPRLNCLIGMNTYGGCGLVIRDNSEGFVGGGKGVQNAGAYGLYVNTESKCIATQANFSRAGWGNRVTVNSFLSASQCDFSLCRNAVYLTTNNAACLDVSRGSLVYITGSVEARTNLQGGKGHGLAVRRSFVSATHVDCSQNERNGVNAGAGSVIAFTGSRVSTCLGHGIACDGSRIDANETIIINNASHNLYADSGGEITARNVTCGGAGVNSVRVANGSRINVSGGTCRRGATDDPTDIVVTGGSIVHAAGATGGTNIPALTFNVAGLIFK